MRKVTSDRDRQQGVVMVSATLILIVLSLIVGYQMELVRAHLHQAGLVRDRAQACVEAKNIADRVAYRILTEGFRELQGETADSPDNQDASGYWNFHGQPFRLEGAVVRLQDTAGLMGMHDLRRRRGRELMRSLGVDEERIAVFSASLSDWQDGDDLTRLDGAERDYYRSRDQPGPRNARVRSLAELHLIRGYPQQLNPPIEHYLTLHSPGYFNPHTAPDELLETVLGWDAEHVIEQRRETPLSAQQFMGITGVSQSETQLLAPSGDVIVTIKAARGEAACNTSRVLETDSDNIRAFAWRERH